MRFKGWNNDKEVLEPPLRKALQGTPWLSNRETYSCIVLQDHQTLDRGLRLLFPLDNHSQQPFAVWKVVSSSNGHRRKLLREFEVLRMLGRSLPQELRESIPAGVRFVDNNGYTILAEDFVPGRSLYFQLRNSWRPWRLPPDHLATALDWLIHFQKTTHVEVIGDS